MNGDMEQLAIEIRNCRKCELWKVRNNPVMGEGSIDARIMFIGEAPGRKEDEQGKPFVGAAGKILDGTLHANGIERKEVYITNVVKCRPPGNRDPSMEEIKACVPYLERQIEIIKPEVIATLGRFSSRYILSRYGFSYLPISSIHGRVFEDRLNDVKIVPLYHPAACIYNPALKSIFMADMRKVAMLLRQ